jgi:hypothetical protein
MGNADLALINSTVKSVADVGREDGLKKEGGKKH